MVSTGLDHEDLNQRVLKVLQAPNVITIDLTKVEYISHFIDTFVGENSVDPQAFFKMLLDA